MKQLIFNIFILFSIVSCETKSTPTTFSEDALNENFVNLEGESVTFQQILDIHKGQTILIDVWASWCRDCIVGLPDLKVLQEKYNDIPFVFLSIDKSQKSWKSGIEKYNITGEHYFMAEGWDSTFSEFIDLDWVPRYMVIDGNSKIKLFKAVKSNDPKLKAHLE